MINNQQALTTIQANLAARDKHIALLEDKVCAEKSGRPCCDIAVDSMCTTAGDDNLRVLAYADTLQTVG